MAIKKLRIERLVNQQVEASFDRATNTLTLSRKGKTVVTFNNEKIDSGALAGHLPEGQVVLPVQNEIYPGISENLVRAHVVEFVGEPWSTWGGGTYRAARVLID